MLDLVSSLLVFLSSPCMLSSIGHHIFLLPFFNLLMFQSLLFIINQKQVQLPSLPSELLILPL